MKFKQKLDTLDEKLDCEMRNVSASNCRSVKEMILTFTTLIGKTYSLGLHLSCNQFTEYGYLLE